ncbi:hypothetical protein B0H10DRAFT_1130266 [Mycena sp. CBHHK59/15]|nr:hypothetical protein B0H10DRAFT_1130266 [Mycena sp. CBHHK59/15]
MSRCPFNEAQLEFLEDQLSRCKRYGKGDRPPRRQSLMIALQASDLGPEVTSQEVGKWFANRVKQDKGQPRASQKTPEQLALLEASFLEDELPEVEEKIRLVCATGLTSKQVDAWFCYRRKKLGEAPDVYTVEFEDDGERTAKMLHAKKAWRQFRRTEADAGNPDEE